MSDICEILTRYFTTITFPLHINFFYSILHMPQIPHTVAQRTHANLEAIILLCAPCNVMCLINYHYGILEGKLICATKFLIQKVVIRHEYQICMLHVG